MKRLIYQVYVGKRSALYDHCIASVAAYCKKYNIEHLVQRQPILMIRPDPFTNNRSHEAVERLGYLPIYEKENAFTYLKSHDQVAIIDSDIWIRPDAPNIFDEFNSTFGAVCEREMPITEEYRQKLVNYTRMQYSTIRLDWKWDKQLGAQFFNMGLMLMDKQLDKYINGTPKQFIRRPEFQPFVDGRGAWKWSTDQTLLNYWINKEKIPTQHMDWKWNGLYKGIRDDKVKEAYFVHFFLKDKLPARGENVEQLMKDVA